MYGKGDYEKLRSTVLSQNLVDKISDLSVDQAWSTLKDNLFEAMDVCIPKKKFKQGSRRTRWMDSTVAEKIKQKKQAYNKYMQSRDGADYRTYARLRNQTKKACRTAVKSYEQSVAKEAKQNPKKFFAYARSKLKAKESVADLNDSGRKASSDMDKANVLNSFFSSVFTDEDFSTLPDCEMHQVDFQLSG